MSTHGVPGDDQARYSAAPLQAVNGDAPGKPPATAHAVGRGDRPRGITGELSLALMVSAELAFVLIAMVWGGLGMGEVLRAAASATGLALLAFHGKTMLLFVGRRLFMPGSP